MRDLCIKHITKLILDIDECATNADTCVDITSNCENTEGGFRCTCKTGFSRLDDFTCTGEFKIILKHRRSKLMFVCGGVAFSL